jgi:hypothetical protein
MADYSGGRYVVKVVFRGLFVAFVREGRVDVLLPDAKLPNESIATSEEPLKTLLSSLQPLREHHAALEFHLADWDNRSDLLPRLAHLYKPTKQPVALYLLDQQELTFSGLYEEEGQPPSLLKEERELYTQLSDGLLLLRQHPVHGYDQLPSFGSDLRPDAATRCAATASLQFGEVYTERRSRRGPEQRLWRSVSVLSYVDAETRGLMNLPEPPPFEEPRLLNLDLVVRFTLALTNPLQITCRPVDPLLAPRYFILKPGDPSRELTIWVKNRELEAILRDSDLDPDPYLAPAKGDATDRDHAMYMRLALDPKRMNVPRDHNDDASDSGSGCGGVKGG